MEDTTLPKALRSLPKLDTSYIFVADLHIDLDEVDRMEVFIHFLEKKLGQGYTIFIMGDLFNFWAGNAQGYVGTVRSFLRQLQEITSTQRLFFLNGNRDFLFSWFFRKRLGGGVIVDGKSLYLGEKKFLLFHGDGLCLDDVNYLKMKSVLQSRFIYLLSHLLPSQACVQIGQKFRQASKKAIEGKEKKEMSLSRDYMDKILSQAKADALICGHIHQPQVMNLGNPESPKQVYVLPECVGQKISYLAWENGALEYREE